MTRPDRDEWHLAGARWLAEMGDCTRRKVGALIVGTDKRFWGLGYNGGRPGGPSCTAGECPRGQHYRLGTYDSCACGNAWPCVRAAQPGEGYDGVGLASWKCIATHAEANAVADAMQRGGGRMPGATMYVSTEPCEGCIRHVRNTTDIGAIIWPEGAIGLP